MDFNNLQERCLAVRIGASLRDTYRLTAVCCCLCWLYKQNNLLDQRLHEEARPPWSVSCVSMYDVSVQVGFETYARF